MSVSLYRRFRPDTFEKLIGQDHIVRTLTNQIKSGRVSHAYLFTGTRGTGKTSTAKIFAKAVNCLNPNNGSPCKECEMCKFLANPANMDIVEIDAASNNGVDEIRELKENVNFAPAKAKYKVYIIDEVHMLSTQAFNALLKTIEEPPSHIIFILATTEIHKLPQTILSRCQRFDFRLVPEKILVAHLKMIFKEIGVKADDRALEIIARHGEGSVRDTVSLADMLVSFCDGNITASDVESALGVSSFDSLTDIASAIINNDIKNLLNQIDRLVDEGKNLSVIARDLSDYFLKLIAIVNLPRECIALNDQEYDLAKSVTKDIEHNRLRRIIEVLTGLEVDMRVSTQPQVIFTATLIKASSLVTDVSIEGLLSRLASAEKKLANIETNGVIVAKDTKESDLIKEDKIVPKSNALLNSAEVVDVKEDVSEPIEIEPTEEAKTIISDMIALLIEKGELMLATALGHEKEFYYENGVLKLVLSSAVFAVVNAGKTEMLERLALTLGASGLVVEQKMTKKRIGLSATTNEKLSNIFGDRVKITNN